MKKKKNNSLAKRCELKNERRYKLGMKRARFGKKINQPKMCIEMIIIFFDFIIVFVFCPGIESKFNSVSNLYWKFYFLSNIMH